MEGFIPAAGLATALVVAAAVTVLAVDRVVGALATGSTIKETRGFYPKLYLTNKKILSALRLMRDLCGKHFNSLPAAVLPLAFAGAVDLFDLVLGSSAGDQNMKPDLL